MIKAISYSFIALMLSADIAAADITVIAVGDIMPSHRVLPFVKKHGHGYPYEATKSVLKDGDIVIGNLEVPLTTGGRRHEEKKYTFRAPIESAKALKSAGFTHMSLANNHLMDYGIEGLSSTLLVLDAAGLNYAGAGKNITEARGAVIMEIKDKKVAFLSFSNTYPTEFYATASKGGTSPGYRKYVTSDIKKAKEKADIVIVAFHWSAEKLEQPKDYQKNLAHLSIDNGADIILGHHPHVLQGVELYKKGVIFYSLGNFAFGSYSKIAKESIIARITFGGGRIKEVEALPINVNNYEVHFRPVILEGLKGEAVISKLSDLSEPLGTKLVFNKSIGEVIKLR